MKRLALLLLFSIRAFAVAPVIFYSDLDSGPATGGENNQGVYISIYGRNFGTSGTITVCGTATRTPVIYGANNNFTNGPASDMATFQLGAGTSGTNCDIVLTTGGGSATLSSAFTVRSGNIYCADISGGNDSNNGTFSGGCKQHIQAAWNLMAAGDTTYVKSGTYDVNGVAAYTATLQLVQGVGLGTSGNPKAIVGYPGSTHTIGYANSSTQPIAILGDAYYNYSASQGCDYLTFANLGGSGGKVQGGQLSGSGAAIIFIGCGHLRVINNRITCPNLAGGQGCMQSVTEWVSTSGPTYSGAFNKYFGNEIYDVTINAPAYKLNHSLYLGTDNHDQEVGWSYIHNNPNGCRGIQMHSSPVFSQWVDDPSGNPLYNLSVHDNWITGQACDGVNPVTVSPQTGYINIYNNVIWGNGFGNSDANSGTYAGINLIGEDNKIYDTSQTGCTWSWSGTSTLTGNGSCNFGVGGDDLQAGWGICYNRNSTYGGCDRAYIQSVDSSTQITLYLLPIYNRYWVFGPSNGGTPNPTSGAHLYYMKSAIGNVNVYNNTFYNNNFAGIGFGSAGAGTYCRVPQSPKEVLVLSNNITYQLNGELWGCPDPGDGTTYTAGSNNVWYNSGTPASTVPSFLQTNQQTGNPNFNSIGSSDFSITLGSSAITNGTASPASTKDIRGFAQTSPVTMGAYTYQSATTSGSMTSGTKLTTGVLIK